MRRAHLVKEVAEQGYVPGPESGPAVQPTHRAGSSAAGEASRHAVDPDMVDDLGDEIAILAAHLHAGKHRLLELIARFDALGGWQPAGHRSCAHWLAFRTGLDLGTAREHVRVANALDNLPLTSESMARGRLSFCQARALTRVADSSTEADLLELAQGCTTAQLERVVRAWKRGSREDETAWERERHESRSLSVFPDDDGMYVVKGRLDPEVGALLMRAIEAASDALFRERTRQGVAIRGSAPESGEASDTEPAQRRADAMGLLAERALTAGFGIPETPRDEVGENSCDDCSDVFRAEVGDRVDGDRAESGDPVDDDPVDDDELTFHMKRPADAPISGSRAERYQVVLHVEHETLAREGEPGRSDLEDGTRVSAETSRRLSCDASLVRVTRGTDGSVLNVGRRTRTIPPALRRALELRDRGCRFPGCGLRFTDAHHVIHWADGGETSLENSVLLCRYHHRLVHEEGWDVEWWGRGEDRAAAFVDPLGQMHVGRPRRMPEVPAGRQALASLVRANRLRGADPDAMTASARWKRETDIPGEVLFRATEAAL